jgi:hypothetical protein
MKRRWVALVAGTCLLTAGSAGVAQGATKPAKKVSVTSALRTLDRQTTALPRTVVSRTQRRKLHDAARRARIAAKGKPCSSVAALTRFRTVLRTVKPRKGKRNVRANLRIASLGPASLAASRLLLADKRTKSCGGGTKPSTLSEAKTSVLSSDINGVKVRVELPAVQFTPRSAGGKSWTQLALSDTTTALGDTGAPGIPVVASTFAVPDGATVAVKTGKTDSYTLDGVDVFPTQPDVVDAAAPTPGVKPNFNKPPFADAPFTIDRKAYASDKPFPAKPADADILGTTRDLTLGGLQIPTGQYDPASKKLKIFKSVEVEVKFSGGSKAFNEELGSPWERPARDRLKGLLNLKLVTELAKDRGIFRRCGEEMLVITNTATQTAADQFATHKRSQGMRTSVVDVGDAAGQIGSTPATIQAYIRGRLTAIHCIHPSYITIMGDDDLVPTFPGINGIPSDLQYAMRNDADELPDVAIGRIIGNDQAAVGVAVTKIIGYETTPPTGAAFTNKAVVAAQYQDDDNDGQENRSFVQFAETVRNGLTRRGVAVQRVYKESPGNNPQRFQDGTALPAALLKPTFAWNGTGADVTAGWNAGPFMVVHRDHGWSDGWSTPGFGTADAQALTNGANLPVVLSINCSSGAYDYDETSFAGEALVNPHGGGVGVFGDTRDSPTNHNSIMALGFVDGMLPSVLPDEGPTSAQRTGDALITGKLRLVGISPPAGDGNTRNELYLWHYYGDPSMQMWGGGHTPFKLDIAAIKAVYAKVVTPTPDPPPYEVNVTLPKELIGQPISLLRKGEVVGKAIIGDGVATIPASFGDGSVVPGDLTVAVEPDGGPAVQAPVNDVPNGTSALSQTCPAGGQVGVPLKVSGKLEGAPAGAKVDVTFVAPTLQTLVAVPPIVVSATVDAQGNWSASVTPKDGEAGSWTVSSAYAGDATHNGSKAGPCTVAVTRQATTLTQNCPADASFQNPPLTVTGHLEGAPVGSVVDVTFTGPPDDNGGPGRVVVDHATTDAKGNWSADLAIVRQDQGDWTITSAYVGDGTFAPANAGPCTVTVGS